jgi:hypothetical protein
MLSSMVPLMTAAVTGSPDRKDTMETLAGVGATMAGFSLVFLALILDPARSRSVTREKLMIYTLFGLFWLDLIFVGFALLWLYCSAPGSIFDLSRRVLGFFYQAAWVTLAFTSVAAFVVVLLAVFTVTRRDPPQNTSPTQLQPMAANKDQDVGSVAGTPQAPV